MENDNIINNDMTDGSRELWPGKPDMVILRTFFRQLTHS